MIGPWPGGRREWPPRSSPCAAGRPGGRRRAKGSGRSRRIRGRGDALAAGGNASGIFVAAAAQALGEGTALLGIVAAGAVGNLINAIVQSPDHSSVGASTASFGAIGLLVAYLWRRRKSIRTTRQQRWTPPFVGLVLLGYLGTSGERTDVMAHITGFFSGAVIGAALGVVALDRLGRRSTQVACGALALGLIVVAWLAAHQVI